jgi:hypothetical protein
VPIFQVQWQRPIHVVEQSGFFEELHSGLQLSTSLGTHAGADVQQEDGYRCNDVHPGVTQDLMVHTALRKSLARAQNSLRSKSSTAAAQSSTPAVESTENIANMGGFF